MRPLITHLLIHVVTWAIGLQINQAYGAWKDVLEATVRVQNGSSRGTGCVVHDDGQSLYVMTNYHVAGKTGNRVNLEFWHRGHQSAPIPGVVSWHAYQNGRYVDIALVKVAKSYFASSGYPPVVPIGKSFDYSRGATIVTVGCPAAKWARLIQGSIVGAESDGVTFKIQPIAEPGQSGSSVFNADGTEVVGLIAWHDGQYGVFQSLHTLLGAFGQQVGYQGHPDVQPGTMRQSVRTVADWRASTPTPEYIVRAPTEAMAERIKAQAEAAGLPPCIIHCHEGQERVTHWPADDPRRKYDLLWIRAPESRMVGLFEAQCGPDGCFRFPWRKEPQPQPQQPPSGNPFPTLPPEGGGGTSTALEARIVSLEKAQAEFAVQFSEVQQIYLDVKAHWPEVREFVDGAGSEQLVALANRIEDFDSQYGELVEEIDKVKDETEAEAGGLKDRLAELKGELLSVQGIIGLLKEYTANRNEGSAPKDAAVEIVKEKIDLLLNRAPPEESSGLFSWGRLATIAGIAGGAAGLPTWLLVGLRGAPKVAGVVTTIRRRRKEGNEEVEEETQTHA